MFIFSLNSTIFPFGYYMKNNLDTKVHWKMTRPFLSAKLIFFLKIWYFSKKTNYGLTGKYDIALDWKVLTKKEFPFDGKAVL